MDDRYVYGFHNGSIRSHLAILLIPSGMQTNPRKTMLLLLLLLSSNVIRVTNFHLPGWWNTLSPQASRQSSFVRHVTGDKCVVDTSFSEEKGGINFFFKKMRILFGTRNGDYNSFCRFRCQWMGRQDQLRFGRLRFRVQHFPDGHPCAGGLRRWTRPYRMNLFFFHG